MSLLTNTRKSKLTELSLLKHQTTHHKRKKIESGKLLSEGNMNVENED